MSFWNKPKQQQTQVQAQEQQVIVDQQEFIEQCRDMVECLRDYVKKNKELIKAENQGHFNEQLMLELEGKNRICITSHNLLIVMCKLKRKFKKNQCLNLGAIVFAQFKEEIQACKDPIERVLFVFIFLWFAFFFNF